MAKNLHNEYIVLDEGLVDISSGKAEPARIDNKKKKKENKNKKSKAVIISCVAAAVAVTLGVTGFCLFQFGVFDSHTNENGDFIFKEGTTVSGISISGKTMEEAKKLLGEKEESFIKPITLSVDADGKITTLTQDDFEYTFDTNAVLATIKSETLNPSDNNTSESKTYEITASVTVDSIEKNSKKIKKATDCKPKNAYVSKFNPYAKNRFEYTDSVDGKNLNEKDLNEKLTNAIAQGYNESRVIAEIDSVGAEVTVDFLKDNIKKLSSYETVSTNTANGTENMRVSLEACNGSVIEPGATWSFNKCTGDSNLESNGYKSAGVIENGQLTNGIGGGICQSSSTIYNAAIRANMKVEERYCHKWASSYVPTGLDATIDYPRLDLKMSNQSKYQMFMECKLVDSTLYVSIWGVQDSFYDEIKTYNEMTSQGSSSYAVKAWRIFYKDGKEVKRESLGSSTYSSDHGYVFIEADNDTNAKDTDVDNLNDSEPTDNSGSNQQDTTTQPPQSSVVTEPPTQPATEPPTEPSVIETEPAPAPTEQPDPEENP